MKLGHGNSDKAIENVALEHAIPVPEEEELVFFDGPTEVAAIIVQDLLGFLLTAIIPCLAALEMLIEMVPEEGAVPIVRPRFRNDVHGR